VRGAPDEEYKELSDVVVRELIGHAVRSRTIDVFVQPIVRLPQRKVRYYEIFARVRARPGLYVPARRYMKLAHETKATNDIDIMLLIQCLKTIRASAHIERAAPLFINISADTLKNAIFMKRLLGFVAENRHLAPRLVFELPHAQYTALESPLREILRGLGRLGCAVSLDHVGNMEFDIADLQKHYVKFIKIGARTMLPYTRSDRARADLQKKKRLLEANSISVIAEKVETEAELLELLDFDIAYGQGHLFGRPDLEAAYRKRRAA
jgi:cyclic-di-GMP phosphodiesterase TipF (flagellum assembly factor)